MKTPVLLATSLVAFLGAAHAAPLPLNWDEGYSNRAGDTLVVGSDPTGIAGFTLILPSDAVKGSVDIYVDADDNGRTGDPSRAGADYRFTARLPSGSWDFLRRRGSSWVSTNLPSLRGGARINAGFQVNRRDIGNAEVIHVVAEITTDGKARRIPDRGAVRYDLRPIKFRTALTSSVTPHALRLGLRIRRSDSGGYVDGDPLCTVHVGAKILFVKSLASADRADAYRASCTWNFAPALSGKRAVASIALQIFQTTITRTFAFTIK